MRWRRIGDGIEIDAPAKVNLFLEILGKRSDGFHEIETLIWPIRRFDTLRFFPNDTPAITLDASVRGIDVSTSLPMPPPEKNLAVRAVMLFREAAQIQGGAHLELIKRIPIEAGLGGGSSDAAAALIAANEAWKVGWPRERLAEVGKELGSDVPFFLYDGPAICRGRGERIEPLAASSLLSFVVVRPPVGLATAEVYRRCSAARTPREIAPLISALSKGDLSAAAQRFHNQLQPAAEQLSPWIERLKGMFDGLNVLGHQMSGSGSSYFALCHHTRQARALTQVLRAQNVGTVFAACR